MPMGLKILWPTLQEYVLQRVGVSWSQFVVLFNEARVEVLI
jgi:hypothetical protein